MYSRSSLKTAQVLAVFTQEIEALEGRVTDIYHDDRRLFARSTLPQIREVRPGDALQRGVAIKATEEQVCVYPYLFRQVCQNGAILAQTIESRVIAVLPDEAPQVVLESIREGIAACCEQEVFLRTVRDVRAHCEFDADMAINLLPLLSSSTFRNSRIVAEIVNRYFGDGDQSVFGLANAVTSVARDTSDPEERWDLEELGGGIAISVTPRRPVDEDHATREFESEEVAVG